MVADGQMPVQKISKLFPIKDFQAAVDAMNKGTVSPFVSTVLLPS